MPRTIANVKSRPQSRDGSAKRREDRRASLALVQFAPRKGNVTRNVERIARAFQELSRHSEGLPDVVVFPEACLSGYFVEGGIQEVALTAKDALQRVHSALKQALGRPHAPVDVVFGFYEDDGGKLYNSALYATLDERVHLRHVHRKLFLPTYGVFDEERFVSPGRTIEVFDTPHGRAAILICEDACHSLAITVAALRGAQILWIPSASPGRGMNEGEPANVRMWRDIMRVAAAEHGIFIAYAGLTGFEGGKGFTGASRLVDPYGDLVAEAPFLGDAILRCNLTLQDVELARASLPALGDLEANLAELSLMLDGEVRRRPARRMRT